MAKYTAGDLRHGVLVEMAKGFLSNGDEEDIAEMLETFARGEREAAQAKALRRVEELADRARVGGKTLPVILKQVREEAP